MDKKLSWYQGKIGEMIANDNKHELFNAIDDMYHGNIELPQQLKDFDDIRLNKDSTPHDALYNATTALSNSKVRFEIMPLGVEPKEYEKANMMEESLTWHWEQSNMRGMARKIVEITSSALRYDLCVTRVEDLMWWLPKNQTSWTKANKRAARNGRFPVTVLPPHSMYFQNSPFTGTSCILSARLLPLTEVVDYYQGLAGKNDLGKKLLKTIDSIQSEAGDDYSELYFMLYDYTDDDKRLVYGHIAESLEDNGGNEDDYVFMDTENKMPFINYTVRGGQSDIETDSDFKYHPMLASAHWHGLWTDAVLAKSLTFSDVIRRLREVRATYEGVGTDQVPPDDGTGGDKALPPGVTRKVQPPTTLDQQAFQIVQEYSTNLNKTTGTSILGNLNQISGSTPYSSIQAQIQLALGNLNPQRNIIQDTIRDIGYLYCEWVKFTKKPFQSWRKEEKLLGETKFPRGQEIQIAPEDYSLDRLHIYCTITPETPTDLTGRINNARLLKELGMSARDLLESLNVPHPEMQLDMSAIEKLKEGAIQAQITKMVGMANMEVQIKQQQAMQAMQQQAEQAAQQQQAQQQSQQPPSPFPGGAGFDPAQGGQPPIEATGAPAQSGTMPNGGDSPV